MPVELLAVVVVVTVPAPWQRVADVGVNALIVTVGVTVIVPVAFTVPQPPVNGML